jgi:hypothetical protein
MVVEWIFSRFGLDKVPQAGLCSLIRSEVTDRMGSTMGDHIMHGDTTSAASRLVDRSKDTLFAIIRKGLIPEPQRDRWGRYIWSEADVERVKQVLANPRRSGPRRRTTAGTA